MSDPQKEERDYQGDLEPAEETPRLSSDPDPDPDADVVADPPPGLGVPTEDPDPDLSGAI